MPMKMTMRKRPNGFKRPKGNYADRYRTFRQSKEMDTSKQSKHYSYAANRSANVYGAIIGHRSSSYRNPPTEERKKSKHFKGESK